MINACIPFFILFLMASCSDKNEKREHTLASIEDRSITNSEQDSIDVYIFPYNFSAKSKQCSLDPALIEVSGLSMYGENQLAAVNDEQGILFVYDMDSCTIKEQFKFGKPGDYEGVEIVNNNELFAITSKGNVYHTKTDDPAFSEVYNTALSQTNDVEGLGYDPERNRLLLACKSSPNIRNFSRSKDTKAVYAFSLEDYTLKEDPVLSIKDDKLLSWFETTYSKDAMSKKKWKQTRIRILDFSPSGIAVHPLDNYYYLLSSVGKTLVVIDKRGAIKHIELLDKKLFRQPEGICFDANGNMFIANEGKAARGKLYKLESSHKK